MSQPVRVTVSSPGRRVHVARIPGSAQTSVIITDGSQRPNNGSSAMASILSLQRDVTELRMKYATSAQAILADHPTDTILSKSQTNEQLRLHAENQLALPQLHNQPIPKSSVLQTSAHGFSRTQPPSFPLQSPSPRAWVEDDGPMPATSTLPSAATQTVASSNGFHVPPPESIWDSLVTGRTTGAEAVRAIEQSARVAALATVRQRDDAKINQNESISSSSSSSSSSSPSLHPSPSDEGDVSVLLPGGGRVHVKTDYLSSSTNPPQTTVHSHRGSRDCGDHGSGSRNKSNMAPNGESGRQFGSSKALSSTRTTPTINSSNITASTSATSTRKGRSNDHSVTVSVGDNVTITASSPSSSSLSSSFPPATTISLPQSTGWQSQKHPFEDAGIASVLRSAKEIIAEANERATLAAMKAEKESSEKAQLKKLLELREAAEAQRQQIRIEVG